MSNRTDTLNEPAGFWRLATKVILGLWALHLTSRILIALTGASFSELFDPALDVALSFGVLLSFGLCAILRAPSRRGLGFALFAASLVSLPVSLVYATAELIFFLELSPRLNDSPPAKATPSEGKKVAKPAPTLTRQMVLHNAVGTVTANTTGWYLFYFGLGSFFVGMRNAGMLRESERRAAQYERLARDSQMQALRYQVNPHFLFNTLNALSALVMAGRLKPAEEMILNLSRFYRSSLAIDPLEDITLAEELALQKLYLDIEAVRFPDRLRLETVIEPGVLDALVPALLLQPLIENTIKHGVARLDDEVTVRVKAANSGAAWLTIIIENQTRPVASNAADGTSTGMRNVADRLKARFGDSASCTGCLVGTDLFRVTVTFPLIQ